MKKLFLLALLAAVTAGAGCLGAVKTYEKSPSLPQVEGTIHAPGINGKVDIYRDQHGIPHIFGDTEEEIFYGAGYVQAQDRLWEMVFLRAVAEGRMCELLGKVNLPGLGNTFQIDLRQRTMGIKWLGDVGQVLLKETSPKSYRQIQAYCDGVNAFIDTHREWKQLPVEFQVLRLRPEHWRPADVISYGMFIGSMLAANMDEELFRKGLIDALGPDLAWQLDPIHYGIGPIIVPNDLLKNRLDHPRDLPPGGRPSDQELGLTEPVALNADFALQFAQRDLAFKRALHLNTPMASNDWIVSGKLTESGHAMLCNDPHLEHLEPSLFYLMHLKGAGIDVIGAAFAGVPYPVLAHTRKLAWGATTPPADVQDIFIETTDADHPGQYLYKGQWRDFTLRKDIIRVRQGSKLKDKQITIRQSVHGPIINEMEGDLPQDAPPMALRWVAWDFGRNLDLFQALVSSATIDEFMGKVHQMAPDQVQFMNIATMYDHLIRGESIEDFKQAMAQIVVPSQNWVAADADGHIIYLPGGLVPIRKKGIGVMPVPGEKGDFDWSGFIPLFELPWVQDPERGYMATANNTVVDQRYYPYLFGTDHDEGWRAWRIEELIKELAPLSMDDMKRIQNDVQIKRAAWAVPKILAAVDHKKPADELTRKAADELRAWNCEATLDSTATVIFFQFNNELRRNTLADEVPPSFYEKHLSGNGMDMVIIKWMEEGGSPFFDDKTTPEVEDMDDMLVKSLHDAMAWVEKEYGTDPANREWGKLHTLTWENPLGIGPLKKLNVGPVPHLGARETVRAAGFSAHGDHPWVCRSGPVLRHIIDMGDPDGAQMIIDGSESGQWLSPHFDDLHKLYNGSQYVTAVMDPAQVKAQAASHLVLEP